jgi:hypothetical protein
MKKNRKRTKKSAINQLMSFFAPRQMCRADEMMTAKISQNCDRRKERRKSLISAKHY